MSDWIKAINPTAPITTEAEALRAARASAVGVGIGVIAGIIGVVQMIVRKDEIAAAAAAATAGDPAAAGMVGMMTQIMLYFAIGIVVIQLILAWVQWAKPNIIIPIVFAILVAGGLLVGLFMPKPPETITAPIWQIALSVTIAVVQMVLHFAGIRGASQLDKIRFAAANQYED